MILGQRNGSNPELADHALPSHVDMGRFDAVKTVKVEAVGTGEVSDSRHTRGRIHGYRPANPSAGQRRDRSGHTSPCIAISVFPVCAGMLDSTSGVTNKFDLAADICVFYAAGGKFFDVTIASKSYLKLSF